jgi:hypothetical protein
MASRGAHWAGYPDRLELRVVGQQGRVFDQLVETR